LILLIILKIRYEKFTYNTIEAGFVNDSKKQVARKVVVLAIENLK